MAKPCLPNEDPNPQARAERLGHAREVYRYSYEWPPGVAVAAEVPKSDTYSTEYIAHILGVTAAILRNLVPCGDLFVFPDRAKELVARQMERLKSIGPGQLKAQFFEVQTEVAQSMTAASPARIDDYGRFYNTIEAPPVWSRWDDDHCFAWQRIAGVNPMVLRRIDRIPEHVAIGERELQRAGGGGSLAAAVAEGRAFACDYGRLAQVPCGTSYGRRKWLPAPYALFVSSGGTLAPVAIQTGPTPDSPVFTPADGHDWRIARLAVNTADATFHEVFAHLGRTHLVMEAVALATHRQLAESHPISVLLMPHLELTLPINHSAATSLIAPGGAIDQIFGGTIEASAGLAKEAIDTFELPAASIEADLSARGLDDPKALPEHPYRDDGLLVWGAVRRFVEAYVRHYYASDAAVAADPELAAWARELVSSEGGRLRGIRPPETVASLVHLVAIMVWTGSAQHAAVNFPQFPYMSALPNLMGAFWAEWPVAGKKSDEAMHLAVMPPYNLAMLQHATVYQLSSLRLNKLGHYPPLHFHDAEVRSMVGSFQADLASVEEVVAARDAGRFLPYPYLLPSAIPASIHI